LIVFERNAGKAITVCIDGHCPVHDPATAARLASEEAENPAPVMEPPLEEETEEEAEQKRREEFRKARTATFERILDQAPAMFTAVQLRTFLRLLVHIDPYNFLEEVAKPFTHRDSRSDPEIDFRKHLLLIIR
jgi:ParB family chromosome partitioning protein